MAKRAGKNLGVPWKTIIQGIDFTDHRHITPLLDLLIACARQQGDDPQLKITNKLIAKIIANETWLKNRSGDPSASGDFKRDAKWSSGWRRLLLHSKILLGFAGVTGMVGGCVHLFRATQLSLINIREEAESIRARQEQLKNPPRNQSGA